MKKKVFFIMSTDDYSGAEAVNFSIIENLKEKYDFYWISKKGKINDFLREKNIKWIEIKNLSVSEINRVLKTHKPDIIHATDYKASVICSITKGSIPLIEHVHNNAPWIKKICINSIAFLFAGLRANKILTVSKAIENEYIFSKFLKNKIECIDNPISREKILSKVNEGFKKTKIYDICCVARITTPKKPKKFVDIIYEIKKKNKNIKCVWVGDGELKKYTIEYAKEKGVDNNIEFVGFKKNPYIYMEQAKIFLLTSEWEGFGLVAFEALTLGLPCVVSNVGGLPAIVDNSCGKLCESVKEFTEEINMLLNNNEYYREKSKFAIIKSKKLDNYEKYCCKLDKIYKTIIKEQFRC